MSQTHKNTIQILDEIIRKAEEQELDEEASMDYIEQEFERTTDRANPPLDLISIILYDINIE